jgi:hypothetical protein
MLANGRQTVGTAILPTYLQAVASMRGPATRGGLMAPPDGHGHIEVPTWGTGRLTAHMGVGQGHSQMEVPMWAGGKQVNIMDTAQGYTVDGCRYL